MDTFNLGASLTCANAMAILSAGKSSIEKGAILIEAAELTHYDSSALATLIELKRYAQLHGQVIQVLNLPKKLLDLAIVYGIESLILDKSAH